jgi:hypothetical protein
MTEYVATCNASSHDTITAGGDGATIELVARSNGNRKMETFLSADKARTFARGILALADGIDGGEEKDEAKPSRPVKVGDRVRVVRNAYDYEDRGYIGRVGTLAFIDTDDQPYRVAFDDYDYWWCAEVELVDEPTALESDAEAPAVDKPAQDRETFIRRAADLASELEIFDDNAVVSMARFLAGE